MDRKEESRRDRDENLRATSSGDAKKCDDIESTASSTGHSYKPLHDINSKNVREYLSSIENAQKRWVEEAKSWPVKDDIQNAQLKWLKEFSSSGSKFLTSTPQPKKKHSQYTLPFSPPRSSADIDPRRGVCIYKPGSRSDEVIEFVSEKGYTVKVARLEESEPVPSFGKHLSEHQNKLAKEERSKEDNLSHSVDSETNVKRSPPRKRYITVRKKLERLKPTTPEKDEDRQKSSKSPEVKHDERREATREYILRKRAERERELEEEKKQEAKALAEKKARLERLKETQQRLIRNALKKHPQVLSEAQEEGDPADLLEHEDTYFWKTSLGSCLPDSVNSKSGPMGRKPSPRSTAAESLSPHQKQITTDRKPPDDSVMSLQAPFVELLLNKDISTKQILEFLEEGNFPNSSHSVGGCSEASHRSESISPNKRLTTSPVPASGPTAVFPSKPFNSKTPKASYRDLSKPSTSVSPKPSIAVPEVPTLSVTLNSFPDMQAYKKKEKQEEVRRSCSENSLSSSSKKNQRKPEKNEAAFSQSHQITSLSGIPHGMEEIARPYNLLMAVTNKRAALEQLKKDSLNKEAKGNEKYQESTNQSSSDKRKYLNSQDLKLRNISEKGVQSKVETSRPTFESIQRPSSLDPSEVRFAQSERLRKPEAALMPARTSDPYVYGHNQSSLHQEKAINLSGNKNLAQPNTLTHFSTASYNEGDIMTGMTVNEKVRPSADRVSVDPLNVPLDLNLYSRISDANSKFTNSEYRNSFYEQSSVNVPPICESNAIVQSSTIDSVDHIDSYFKSAKTSAVDEPTFVEELNRSCRDSRIENEIRKLDSFNESIAAVMEKNKTIISQNDPNVKSSNEESSVLDKTGTSSTINNDLVFEISQSTILRGSHSSSSFDLASEDVSGKSIAKFSLNMFTELLKDEDLRSAHQASIFKMKESTITEKTKAEIAFLELEKKKLKQTGNEEGIRNIRKKIRGLIIKLQHELEELHKVRRLEKNSYRKRRQRLVDKINLIKMQLKTQTDPQNKAPKDTSNINSGSDAKKIHVTDRRGSDMRAFLERKKKELESRELALAERLAELENISSWKQRLEEGEKKIQELEARLKISALQGTQKEEERQAVVERGTSPLRLTSDESQGERQKAESYSDTFDQASSSSTHDRLEGKDARKMMAIKVPLSPRITMKRRHSSGSDESLLFSQTETQSEASDMEVRVLALQQQLKQRKAKLELLHREYKKSQRERLIAKEQSLLSQIQAYDLYIDQVRKELEKEKEGSNVKVVKPLIKQPKIVSERRKSDTWLIQDKEKHESAKNSLQSSFLVSAAGGLASPTKEHQKSSGRRGNDFNLDTKSLERLSLKSKLPFHLNSFSDPNLLESIEEPPSVSKVSQSSAESCESDVDKACVRVQYTDGKDRSKQCEKTKTPKIPKDITHKSALPSNMVLVKERTEKISRKNAVKTEPEVEKANVDSYENDLDNEDSEENTLTQQSIVPKVNEDFVDSEQSKTVEDVSQKSSEGSKENISEEIHISVSGSAPKTDVDTSIKKSEKSVDEEPFLTSQNDHKDNGSTQNEVQIDSESVVEFINEKASPSFNERTSDETTKTHSISDQSNGNVEINSRNESLKKIRNTLSDTSKIESELRISHDDSQKSSKTNIPNENDKPSIKISSNEVIEEGMNEISNEESVRELTYLEVSDHAIPEDVYANSKEMREDDAVETSSAPEVESNDALISQELEEGNESLLKKQLSNVDTSQKIPKENTSQSLSEIEEHLSKDTLDDMSDGSFPLPVTKNLNQENIPESIEKNIPESVRSNSSNSENEIRESVASDAKSLPVECSNKESLISEVIPSVYSISRGTEENSASDHTVKESVASGANSLEEQSNEGSRGSEVSHSNRESAVSEVNSASDHSKNKSTASEDISVQEHSNEEYILSERNTALEHTNKESEITEVNSEIEHSIKESIVSEVNSELEFSNKESIVSEVCSELEHSIKESVASEVNTELQLSNKVSVISEVNSEIDHSNKESVVSEVNSELGHSNEKSIDSDEKSHTIVPSNKESVASEYILSAQEEKEPFFNAPLDKSASVITEVVDSVPTEVPSSHNVEIPKDVDEQMESQETSISQGSILEEEQSSITINESVDKSQNGSKNIEDEAISEIIEEGKSFSENLVENDAKSPLDVSNLDDSLGEHSDLLKSFNLKSKLYGKDEEYDESASDSTDSFIDERSSEEDMYNVKTPLRQPQQMWTQETDLKGPGAPLMEALQREGGSALDVVWRGIAEAAVEEATQLVISTFIKKKQQEDIEISHKELQGKTEVGENDEEWRREKLSQQQAEAEAEILRLQQLRIDKEIEALEEEEARQYFYVRAIPDKPPPPYTPRRSSLVSSVLEAAGELWSGQSAIPPAFMPGSHLRDFIWDLAGELVRRVSPSPAPAMPPWVQSKRRRPKKPIRTKEQLLEEVEKEAKIYLGVEEREVRENLIIRWSKKRRDHVDEILVRESQEEEWEWTDFTVDENIIKNKIAQAIIEDSISTATAAFAQAFERKFGSD